MTETLTRRGALILDAREVGKRPWEPFGENDNVRYRSFWLDTGTGSYAGLLRLAPGATVASHTHHCAVHHVWVVEGECMMGGRSLGRGSYAFVPANADHGIELAGLEGCTLFYLYLRADID